MINPLVAIAGGGVAGFFLGGPVGAVLGAAAGFGGWVGYGRYQVNVQHAQFQAKYAAAGQAGILFPQEQARYDAANHLPRRIYPDLQTQAQYDVIALQLATKA